MSDDLEDLQNSVNRQNNPSSASSVTYPITCQFYFYNFAVVLTLGMPIGTLHTWKYIGEGR